MSLIRASFICAISDSYASHYYILGERGEVRYIRLVNSREQNVTLPQIFRDIAGTPDL
jgi:hypothetical protein